MAFDPADVEHNVPAALDAGMNLSEPHLIADDTVAVFMTPKGASIHQLDLTALRQKYADRPLRKSGTVTLTTAGSFIDWVNRNKTPETVIYGREKDTSFRAIFNGHEANMPALQKADDPLAQARVDGRPGHGDFIAIYGCPLSIEWARWMKNSQHDADKKVGMPHAEFLQFIEDNLLDITDPASGDFMARIMRFDAKRDVKFGSAKRLDNGDISFAYSEDTQQVVPEGRSDLTLPSKFTITIPVFQKGLSYAIDANLRYRAGAGGLHLWFELVRPHKSLEHAFNAVAEEIAAGTSVPMFAT